MRLKIKTVLSSGITYGNVFNVKSIIKPSVKTTNEIDNFNTAINKSINQINEMLKENEAISDYLNALKLMISDDVLISGVRAKINDGIGAYESIEIVMEEYKKSLANSDSSYLKERVADIEDVEARILSNLNSSNSGALETKKIIYVDTLLPTFLIANRDNILGVVAKNGGYTSHCAILCRGWNIPFVIVDDDFESDEIIIDTYANSIVINPTEKEIERCKRELKKKEESSNLAISHPGFLFLANVGSNQDLKKVIDCGFDGVGLYRTEMIFMRSTRPLTVEEQLRIYLDAANAMHDKFICFRTFDVGDDKKLSYLKTNKKGIDNYLNNAEIFESQIKALCLANIHNNIKIMFPMIETEGEFCFLRQWVRKIAKELRCNIPQIGMMLETKKALENIEAFKSADFISIGTNDLTHELYNIDRENALNDFDIYLKDLLHKIKKVVKFCEENNILLSVCGELAGISRTVLSLYKLGIRNLSVSPSAIKTLNSSYKNFINMKTKL